MTEAPAQPSTTVQMSTPVDGFRLAYRDRCPADWGPGDPVAVLLHGWPGDAEDYRQVVPLIDPRVRVVVPDLRGFGESDRLPVDPEFYGAQAQTRAVATLLTELGVREAVVAGYDVGSRVAQTMAHEHPEHVAALALCPPLPGAGVRVLQPHLLPELWYQFFHRIPREWSDRLDEWFSDVSIRLVAGVGHFVPVEAPRDFADLVAASLARSRPQTTQRADSPAVRSHRPSQ